jgi:membrane-anchored protein YejM (alkaline phosphatase superfamily)
MMDQQTGKYLLIAGLIIVVAGILIYFFHDYFKWIGRLPGDIRIEKENFRLYFPLTTMIIFSLAITIIIQIFKRFF